MSPCGRHRCHNEFRILSPPYHPLAQNEPLDKCIYVIYTPRVDPHKQLLKCVGFEWDEGNVEKNWRKHNVSGLESEQVFFNQPLIVKEDVQHSKGEPRFYALGQTDKLRYLFVVFTFRKKRIRVISVRDMNKNERSIYKLL